MRIKKKSKVEFSDIKRGITGKKEGKVRLINKKQLDILKLKCALWDDNSS